MADSAKHGVDEEANAVVDAVDDSAVEAAKSKPVNKLHSFAKVNQSFQVLRQAVSC